MEEEEQRGRTTEEGDRRKGRFTHEGENDVHIVGEGTHRVGMVTRQAPSRAHSPSVSKIFITINFYF